MNDTPDLPLGLRPLRWHRDPLREHAHYAQRFDYERNGLTRYRVQQIGYNEWEVLVNGQPLDIAESAHEGKQTAAEDDSRRLNDWFRAHPPDAKASPV
jgi:hypothetical protein